MVRAESSPREEILKSILKRTEFRIGRIRYVSKVIHNGAYCFKCDFVKVKNLVSLLVRTRVCACCNEADRYLRLGSAHVLIKLGKEQIEDEDQRGFTQNEGDDA